MRLCQGFDAAHRRRVTKFIMERKSWLFVAAALALAVVYAVYFTNWFRPATVKIFHTNRNLRPQAARGAALPWLVFGLSREVRLTELRVVELSAYRTNRNVLPFWYLNSTSNSVPVKTFFYGQFIRGLKPAIPGSPPRELGSNITYRLLIKAGKITGEHDFELK
jgi:hypothetical protein